MAFKGGRDPYCAALAWYYLGERKGLVVSHPPRNPPGERLLNWTTQLDVPVWGKDRAHRTGIFESLFLSSSLLKRHSPGCNEEAADGGPAVCEMLPWIKTLTGCEKQHIPLLFIFSLNTGCCLTGVWAGDCSDLASQCLPRTESQSTPYVVAWFMSHLPEGFFSPVFFFAYLGCQFDVWSQAAVIWDNVKSTLFYLPAEPFSMAGKGVFSTLPLPSCPLMLFCFLFYFSFCSGSENSQITFVLSS